MNHPATVDTAVRDSAAPRARVLAVHPGAEMFGSDRMFLESVIGLAAACEVVVALPEDGPLAARIREEGIRVELAPMLTLRKALLRPRGWFTLARDTIRNTVSARWLLRTHSPDAVYVSTVTLPLWPVIARIHGQRVVSHVHEAESTAGWLMKRALYAPQLASHEIIVNSEFSLRTLVASFPSLRNRVRLVFNGVVGPASPSPIRQEAPRPVRLLFIGRLSPRKGPHIAIDALKILLDGGIDASLDVLGAAFRGYEWFDDELHTMTDRLGLRSRVRFHGFEEEVWSRLNGADILLVPSIVDETFGNTAVEGILARRPVIASDTSGLREAAGGYPSATLVAPEDPDAIAHAVQEFVGRWPDLGRATELSADVAHDRHAPERYRSSIAAAVTEHLNHPLTRNRTPGPLRSDHRES